MKKKIMVDIGSESSELILLSVYKCWTACQLVSLCDQN